MTDRTHDLVTALHSAGGRADLLMQHNLRRLGAGVTQPLRSVPSDLAPEMEVACLILGAHPEPLRMLRGILGDAMTGIMLMRASGCNPLTREHQHKRWCGLEVICCHPQWEPLLIQTALGDELRWSPAARRISEARAEYRQTRAKKGWGQYNRGFLGVFLYEVRTLAPSLSQVWEAEATQPALPADPPPAAARVSLSDLI